MAAAIEGGGVSGLAGFVIRAWKSRAAPRQARALRVEESLALGGRKQLHMVSCGGHRFLVGTGADAVQCIVAVGQEDEIAVGG